ncbi:maleylpyruvate isomerase family mycothiol-dependent enzyme [Antrihabitans stalactiti]|uniref:Maleylpyruvate isomerase family mycothiol-dependent enzyme n=1 Tax=Antrihabitans stalactiti TaxID=2584121 RepID=A0A848KCB4_9NOCA|nr:maleylpyruvate isomerase family mycothiol-dependent enzyme [Antrihabitans stalactiti]NMN95941.1 maleylpyruvate isomerase family mycothiol-dependent enzyme [Antrihabitans stalactiti]
MEFPRYLELIRADSELLLEAAEGDWQAPVPSCPGWTALDLVRHVGQVYEHKVLCMTLDREPVSNERTTPESGAWFIAQRDALLEQLLARDPRQQTQTWFPPDQTVGFWYRRMALETAVHRVDAELANSQRTAIDADLAADGVDELLGFVTYDFGDTPELAEGAGRTVQLDRGKRRWAVTLRTDGVDRAADDSPADAGFAGEPSNLLLYLWNRDRSGVRSWGDPAALAAFLTRLGEETQ